MLNIKKLMFISIGLITLLLLGACGANEEEIEETSQEQSNNAAGIVLAGQESPEVVGILKNMESIEDVIVTVDGQDMVYRISEQAVNQIENKEIEYGQEVTFTTFSIGDQKETIEKFITE